MALVVVSGQPSSGKSKASAELRDLLQDKGLDVTIIDEPTLQLVRNESYKGEHWQPLRKKLYSCGSVLIECQCVPTDASLVSLPLQIL